MTQAKDMWPTIADLPQEARQTASDWLKGLLKTPYDGHILVIPVVDLLHKAIRGPKTPADEPDTCFWEIRFTKHGYKRQVLIREDTGEVVTLASLET